MTKEEILKVWTESNIITNFNVGVTEDEVLDRQRSLRLTMLIIIEAKKSHSIQHLQIVLCYKQIKDIFRYIY